MMMPASEIGWEALHLPMHTNGLCAARSALIIIPSTAPLVRNGAGSVVDSSPGAEGGGAERRGEEGGGGLRVHMMTATSQSIWINSP